MKTPCLAVVLIAGFCAFGRAASPVEEELAGYRTVQTAQTTQPKPGPANIEGLTGYLGISVGPDSRGNLVVAEVAAGSPAASAGMRTGDMILKLAGQAVKNANEVRALLQAKAPGDVVAVALRRGGKKLEVTTTLGALSRPMQVAEERGVLGLRMSAATDAAGIAISTVTTNKPAALAGLKRGDVILSVNGTELGEAVSLNDKLSEMRPGDSVTLRVRRGTEEWDKTLTLVPDDEKVVPPEERRILRTWKKPVFRLAVLRVEFPDTKHNPAIRTEDWEQAYFSRNAYRGTNSSGQKTYGSVADYYDENSCGKLAIEGRVFDWIELPKKRSEYTGLRGNVATGFFTNVVAVLESREGTNVLKEFDGVAVIYSGDRASSITRGSFLWPHRSNVTLKRKSWPYVIVPEGGKRMSSISTMCHELGHILGLPDLYARPENPGSEGAGSWDAMSNQSPGGRPQHFGAWCKEQLGWLAPAVIDPAVKQKLVLGPIEGSTNECFKVLVRPDGSEYFLLENRRKKGFDASLPAEGLLIWRVVRNRPILEEAHGVTGPSGPRLYLSSVPFPSHANHSFTPFTTPSSHGQLGGGEAVFITNIRQLSDGRIAFHIGHEFD
jgi:M6 family metalloprotease-like protein